MGARNLRNKSNKQDKPKRTNPGQAKREGRLLMLLAALATGQPLARDLLGKIPGYPGHGASALRALRRDISDLRDLGWIVGDQAKPTARELISLGILWDIARQSRNFPMRGQILSVGRRFLTPAPKTKPRPGVEVVSMAWDKGSRIEKLSLASWQGRRAFFSYRRPTRPGLKAHKVNPYGMGLYQGSWYLVAHDEGRGSVVTFRLSRIFGLRLGSVPGRFKIPPGFDVRDHVGVPEWTFGSSLKKVKVRISTEAIEAFLRIPARFGKFQESGQGGHYGTLWVGNATALARFLLPFGKQVTIDSPVEIRDLVHTEALKVLGNYA